MRYFIYCRKSSESEDRQVLSIESQQNELKRAFGSDPAIQIVASYDEAFSAKAPGRRLFDQMLQRIERGEADGIIAWHPDRLARNSVDGGKIIWFLDRKLIKDLKFATYTFENNPQGKFMLSIFLGQSKYYVDSLSENVKRGNRTKVEKGWRPNSAPIGYLNCKETRTIIADPERFHFVRRMFDLMLTGAYSARNIRDIARDEWAFRTRKRKRIGGKPLSTNGIYWILANPFYAGVIVWNGQMYPGKHEAMISLDEFKVVQKHFSRRHQPRPQKKAFAFTGMLRCGVCGLSVTAEDKVNRFGSRYTYYHCTRNNSVEPRCKQPSIQAGALEAQVLGFLESIALSEGQHQWALKRISEARPSWRAEDESGIQALKKETAKVPKRLDALISLRVNDMIGDDEFVLKRAELQQEQLRLASRIEKAMDEFDAFEPVTDFISFSCRAVDWFRAGDADTKRLILQTTGSHPTLTDKILRVTAKKPFFHVGDSANFPDLCAVLGDVRTLRGDPEFETMLANIKKLRSQFEGDQDHRQEAA